MARNSDPELLMHARAVKELERRQKAAIANKATAAFINQAEADIERHKVALGHKTN